MISLENVKNNKFIVNFDMYTVSDKVQHIFVISGTIHLDIKVTEKL